MNCARFHQLLDACLPDDLPAEGVDHAATCADCAEELTAQRLLGDVLDGFGRASMQPGFFARQQATILERVRQEVAQSAEAAWRAPAGSLVLLFGVVAIYLYAGLDVYFGVSLGGPCEVVGADPLESVSVVYMVLAGFGLYMAVGRDASGHRIGSAGARG